MTDTKALDALIEAVEAGGAIQPFVFQSALNHGKHVPCAGEAFEAYHHDLNAAKALHEALLPGWMYLELLRRNNRHTCHIAEGFEVDGVCAISSDSARAWLLAVLKAYRAGL